MKKKRYKDIFEAIEYNDIEGVKLFLPEHANDKDKYGSSALVNTIIAENKQIFDLLLKSGADPYAGTNRDSILQYLWYKDWPDKIQAVVDHGLDLNSVKENVYSKRLMITNICYFLGFAYVNNIVNNIYIDKKLAFLKELIRCGARTDIPDENGKLPLDYLPDKVRTEIEAYIANIESERRSNTASETEFYYRI